MQSKGKKTMLIAAVAVIALFVGAGLTGLILSWTGSDSNKNDQAEVTTPKVEDNGAVQPDKNTDDAVPILPDSSSLSVEIDSNGLGVMPYTSDPREAAAAAAVIAYSVDTTKVDYEEYLKYAIYEMTLRSFPDNKRPFVGPGPDEAFNTLMANTGWEQDHSYTHIMRSANSWQRTNERYWNWWVLTQETQYSMLSTTEAVWTGEAIQVLDVVDIAVLGEKPPYRVPERNWVASTPGASLNDYWVRVKVDESMRGHVYNTSTQTAIVSVWCDPPEAGGNCAVLDILKGPIPRSWAN